MAVSVVRDAARSPVISRDVSVVDATPPTPPAPAPLPMPAEQATVRWIAAGGGSSPVYNQISLAQDIELARNTFSGPGIVLFSSGPGAFSQIEREREQDEVLAALGTLFDARAGRSAHYERAPVQAHAEATAVSLLSTLQRRMQNQSEPLLLYIAAHGDGGEHERDGKISLWEDSELTVETLSQVLDAPALTRPVRMVITSCFGGGFAELVFRNGRVSDGPTERDRCGLFATTWDREASGCDPRPDRRAQQGYGLHFLHALRGENREGTRIENNPMDVDRNGSISLLEAHTQARIEGRSIDVPTTTSERWLRATARGNVSSRNDAAPWLPEEERVIAELSRSLRIEPSLSVVRSRRSALEERTRGLEEQYTSVEERYGEVRNRLQFTLLARWPVLDDPWHPDWLSTLQHHRTEIAQALNTHPAQSALEEVLDARDTLDEQLETTAQETALLLRLERSLETRALAVRARAEGGERWRVYERLLRCERSTVR